MYQVQDLKSARIYLASQKEPIVITNAPCSTRYYGMLVVDYMFKTLQREYSNIKDIIVNVADDHAALITAVKYGYKNIIYTGTSNEAKALSTFSNKEF